MNTPDPGTPPVSYKLQQDKLSSILNDSDPEYLTEDEEQDNTILFDTKTTKRSRKPRTKRKKIESETVTIENQILEFSFPVTDFCETELALIFVLKPEDFRITPKADTKFNLTFRHNSYPVFYIGGTIYFPKYNIYQIIFIKNLDLSDDKESDS